MHIQDLVSDMAAFGWHVESARPALRECVEYFGADRRATKPDLAFAIESGKLAHHLAWLENDDIACEILDTALEALECCKS